MMERKQSHQNINQIVNQLNKLKNELKSIKSVKSMKTLPLVGLGQYQTHAQSTQKKHNKKQHKNKSSIYRHKHSVIQDQYFDEKKQIQTQRTKLGNKIDMSLCKQIRKSLSKSKSKSKGKKLINGNQTHKQMQKKSKDSKKKVSKKKSTQQPQRSSSSEQEEVSMTKKKLKEKSMQKKDSLCNIFAATKSLRKPIKPDHTIPEEIQQTYNKNESQKQNNFYEINRQKELRNQNQLDSNSGRKQDKINAHKAQSLIKRQKNDDIQISFNQKNYRLKVKNNYAPKFNSINFHFPAKDIIYSLQSNEVNMVKQKQTSYTLKLEVLLNKLSKTLLRYPNFSSTLVSRFEKDIPITLQRYHTQINQKSVEFMTQRYTQYLQQVQCDINEFINFVNQYQNEKQSMAIKQQMTNQQSRQKLPQKDNTRNKQNILQNMNIKNAQENELVQNYVQQMKVMKKHIKRLEKDLKQKDQQFMQLQFKYVLKCQQYESDMKYNLENKLNQVKLNQTLQQKPVIQSHMQILVQENEQLYQNIELMKREAQQKDKEIMELNQKLQNQGQNARIERFKVIQIQKKLKRSNQQLEMLQQDIKLKQNELSSIKEKLRQLHNEKNIQIDTLKRKIHQLSAINQQSQKETKEKLKEIAELQRQIAKITNSKDNLVVKIQRLSEQLMLKDDKIKALNTEIKKSLENNTKNIAVLNKKVQELTQQNHSLIKQIDTFRQQNDKLKQQHKNMSSQIVSYRQRLMSLEKVERENSLLKKENIQMSQILQQQQQKITELTQNIQILKQQLQSQYSKVQQLEQSIQRYKDRCVKAEIHLKEQRYLQSIKNPKQPSQSIESQSENGMKQMRQLIQQHQQILKKDQQEK